KKADGTKQEEVEFHNIVVFGKTAENVQRYLTKGSSAYVEGRIKTRSWEKDGTKHYKTEIVAETVQFGPRKQGEGAPAAAATQEQGEEIASEDIPY
ncbi:MAG: single-stranded DNA-binding protein, partial [Patescibacteria group bacterium]